MKFPVRLLARIGTKYLLRHAWQSILMVIGITLGVAIVVAIDLANANANQAFKLSAETVAGRATDVIVGGPQGIDQRVYVDLRRNTDLVDIAPIIDETISSPNLGDLPFRLLGIDPFAEAPFNDYFASGAGVPPAQLTAS